MSSASIVVHTAAAAPATGIDPLTIGLVVLLGVMVIFMFRNSRKRKRDAEELQNQFIPGAEVMTQHGIFGTLISVDDDTNEAIIETTPGTKLRVHRQTISRVVTPVALEDEVIEGGASEQPTSAEVNADHAIPAGDPQYGERASDETDTPKPTRAPRKKAAE